MQALEAESGGRREVVKVFAKTNQLDVAAQERHVRDTDATLADCAHYIPYSQVIVEETACFLVRPLIHANAYDRLTMRPLFSADEKTWIAFQLLKCLHVSHERGCCHGDIKIDNLLLTSWNWVYLSDYAAFKPTLLPDVCHLRCCRFG